MSKRIVAVVVSFLFVFVGLVGVSAAKDVTAKGSLTKVEDDGKSITLKTDAGEELTCKVSSKRSKVMKGSAAAAMKELAEGKKVTVVYDDENPGKEAKTVTIEE